MSADRLLLITAIVRCSSIDRPLLIAALAAPSRGDNVTMVNDLRRQGKHFRWCSIPWPAAMK
ncbi:hypothetical protein O7632_17810 [Solwaraspora sp. WMMD406]|uniref:hypothetical protein n=1 Tax=Solwaraspora sp. WMMD406 TaxID=3016095 RepID=UPI002415D7AB|nr:hypothetical protein [Solwaraspora sp. WMMD406]MDG4765941.1 hypothetical protein [Solwaraspora sp. WMMD406]